MGNCACLLDVVALSLTLGPSPAGRGKQQSEFRAGTKAALQASIWEFFQPRRAILSLPAGEGRGEGERAESNCSG